MNILLIYNPAAGNGTFKNHLDSIVEAVQKKGFRLIPFRISTDQALDEMLSSIDLHSFSKIWIAGGDGTIHQVINALLQKDYEIPIGIYPVGTANDFAHYFNFPFAIDEMTEILLRDNYTYCDVGIANGHYFLNVASLGFLIDVSQKTDKKIKKSLGILAYYLKGAEEIANLKPVRVSIRSKEFNRDEEVYFMLIMNGKSAGGFKKIAPVASLSDGLLDIYIFRKCPIIELISLVIKVTHGEHAESPYVSYFQTAELTIDCKEKIGTDMDGEKGFDFPLTVSVHPGKLKIITRNNREEGYADRQNFSFHDVKKAVEMISNGLIHEVRRPFKEIFTERNMVMDVIGLASDMSRHNALNYINKNSLNEQYFEIAQSTLNNGYLYIILSSTGSAAGELIQKVTKKEYAHASIAFDEDLKTIVSYNGGENIYAPGLNQELIEFFSQKEDANIIIYKIQASRKQKEKVLDEIRKINEQGSSYNVLGLFVPYTHRENIMFCSQFVYCMLVSAGLNYFKKRPEEVKPTDFVELDYKRNLEYHTQLFMKDFNKI
jgi:YegS/Rv2252/BmrU family lipid kinase